MSPLPASVEGCDWRTVSAGNLFACGVKTDDTLWCWGYQRDGRLGNGVDDSDFAPTPMPIGRGVAWSSVSASHGVPQAHACAVRVDGTLWCWGYGGRGQLGIGTTDDHATPMQVGSDEDWVEVSAGFNHTCARKTDGRGYCWGNNGSGVLGEFVGNESLTPVEIIADMSWSTVRAGQQYSCGVAEDGALWCWGSGAFASTTEPLDAGVDWASVAVNGGNLCALRGDGTLHCGGQNHLGALAQGSARFINEFTQLPEGDWSAVTLSAEHTCGRKDDGTLRCFGGNFWGSLGDGTSALETTPAALPGNDWTGIAGTHTLGCGLRDGALWCWGQTGVEGVGYSAAAVAQGETGLATIGR